MKKAAALLFSMLLISTLISCKNDFLSSTDLLCELIAVLPEHPDFSIYFSGGSDEHFVDDNNIKKLFNGVNPCAVAADYAFCLSADDRLFEIFVFRAESADLSDELDAILRRRITMVQKSDVYLYDEEWFETVVASAETVYRHGYAFLLITPYNRLLADTIRKSV